MILVMGLVFVFWAFFSFFVHMLVAVLFPVVAGLVLGFWVYMWRSVSFWKVSPKPHETDFRVMKKFSLTL